MNEPSFLNTVRDHNKYKKLVLYAKERPFFVSVLVNQPTVHSGGARGGYVAVAVTVGDRGKVTCDM